MVTEQSSMEAAPSGPAEQLQGAWEVSVDDTASSCDILAQWEAGNIGNIDIQRIKLEVGEVSTLENDPPADFDEELKKCQRFLYVYHSMASSRYAFMGYTHNTSYANLSLFTPEEMRIVPQATITGGPITLLMMDGTGRSIDMASVQEVRMYGNNIALVFTGTGFNSSWAPVIGILPLDSGSVILSSEI